MGTPTAYIRPRALYLLRRAGDVLLIDWLDEFKNEPVWLAPGGSIEHGELALAAAYREMQEEVGLAGVELRHLATFENIFEYGGATGHEVCFAFEGEAPPVFSEQPSIQGMESNGETLTLNWVSTPAIEALERPLWPVPLRECLLRSPFVR